MPDELTPALLFVLGAVVVGGIALARELFVDRKRWRREREAYDRMTRAARRLVANEIDTARSHLAVMLDRNEWPPGPFVDRAEFLPTTEWERNKSRLAEAVDDDNTFLYRAYRAHARPGT